MFGKLRGTSPPLFLFLELDNLMKELPFLLLATGSWWMCTCGLLPRSVRALHPGTPEVGVHTSTLQRHTPSEPQGPHPSGCAWWFSLTWVPAIFTALGLPPEGALSVGVSRRCGSACLTPRPVGKLASRSQGEKGPPESGCRALGEVWSGSLLHGALNGAQGTRGQALGWHLNVLSEPNFLIC
jgi:hypothetical protein